MIHFHLTRFWRHTTQQILYQSTRLLPYTQAHLRNVKVKPITREGIATRTVAGMVSQFMKAYDPSGIMVEIYVPLTSEVVTGDKIPVEDRPQLEALSKLLPQREASPMGTITAALRGANMELRTSGAMVGRDHYLPLGEMLLFAKSLGRSDVISWHHQVRPLVLTT